MSRSASARLRRIKENSCSMRSVTSIKGAAAPANPIKVISASKLWRCGVALHTEKTAIECDDAER